MLLWNMETLWNIMALWNIVTSWNMMTLAVYDDFMKYIISGNSKVVKCGNSNTIKRNYSFHSDIRIPRQ